MGQAQPDWLPWPLFGRTATLNAATHCASTSSSSPGQHAYLLVADVFVSLYGSVRWSGWLSSGVQAASCDHGPSSARGEVINPRCG
jgi:hypothetical protein